MARFKPSTVDKSSNVWVQLRIRKHLREITASLRHCRDSEFCKYNPTRHIPASYGSEGSDHDVKYDNFNSITDDFIEIEDLNKQINKLEDKVKIVQERRRKKIQDFIQHQTALNIKKRMSTYTKQNIGVYFKNPVFTSSNEVNIEKSGLCFIPL